MPIPDSLAHKMETFRARGFVVNYRDGMFLDASWIAVYLGQRVMPLHDDPLGMAISEPDLKMRLDCIRHHCEVAALRIPSHADFIRQIGAHAH